VFLLYVYQMARPKADDPKVVIALRLRRSLAALVERDPNWRETVERLVAGHYVPKAAAVRAAPAVRVDVPVFERKAFNPQPKSGKR
jgi:hypothetical protein